MDIQTIRRRLADADRLLISIQVSGDSVIALAQARMILKEVFDKTSNEIQEAKDGE